MVILSLARAGRSDWAAPAPAAYIVGAYWFTASTSFANPAVTIGRTLSDTFAGISPTTIPGFVVAQCVGRLLAAFVTVVLWPRHSTKAAVAIDIQSETR